MQTTSEITPFVNEPFTDFSVEENAAAFRAALEKVEASLPVVVRLHIDGEDCDGGAGTFESIDPSLVDNELIFPSEEFLSGAYGFMELDEKTRQQYDKDFARVIGA